MVAETKHFKNTMKFIDTVNKPLQKIAKKTNSKLTTFKKAVIKTVEKKIESPIIQTPKPKSPKKITTKINNKIPSIT